MEHIRSTVSKWLPMFAFLTSLYHLIVASGLLSVGGIFIPATIQRCFGLLLVLTCIYFILIKNNKNNRSIFIYILLYVGSIVGCIFPIVSYGKYISYSQFGYLDFLGTIMVFILIISLIIATKLRLGWVISIVVVVMTLVVLFQRFLPGILRGPAFPLERLGFTVYVGTTGIFGIAFTTACTTIISFIIFGALFEASGGGKWFIDLAISLTNRMVGGAAKTAVIASGLFGMLSGSPSSNVATTGVFTIPLIRAIGGSPAFAGAVEAVASSGGMIMPPVMGAIAFVMAEWLNTSYLTVVKAAILPAILYYLVLFISVDLVARRDVFVLPQKSKQGILSILLSGWFYLLPACCLVYILLVRGFSPSLSALVTIPVVIGSSYFSKNVNNHITLKRFFKALENSALQWLTIALITATIGIMMGALELSGLGIRISSFLIELTRGNLLFTLILVALASFVLGMGLNAVSVYITLVILTAPALVQLGVSPIAAHLFVIYFGLSSFITPPVCLAVYTACSISGGDIWKTGWEAVKLGAAVFIVPFAFIYCPSLLMDGTSTEIIITIITTLIGSALLAGGIQGYFLGGNYVIFTRVLLIISGLLMIFSNMLLMVCIAIVLVLITLLLHFFFFKKFNLEYKTAEGIKKL